MIAVIAVMAKYCHADQWAIEQTTRENPCSCMSVNSSARTLNIKQCLCLCDMLGMRFMLHTQVLLDGATGGLFYYVLGFGFGRGVSAHR